MLRRVVCVVVALCTARVDADGISISGGSPRAIGRAGAAALGDDGGGALLINPAAMARRDTLRIQLGAAVVEDSVYWQSDAEASPHASGQAGARLAPIGAVIGAIGHWVIGAGALTAGISERSLRRPSAEPAALGSLYDYRYTGIAGSYRRDTVVVGAAHRIGDSLALGLSLGAGQVRVFEHRRIWAGLGEQLTDPAADIELRVEGTDAFTTSAVAGVMYAAPDAPIELGASIAWTQTAHVEGTAVVVGNPPFGPTVEYRGTPHASLDVRQPLAIRAAGRYIGERLVLELGGDLWISDATSATWHLCGARVLDSLRTTAVELTALPSRISEHTHVATRTAVDVAVLPGFLWLTAGYAYSTLGTPASRLSPTFGDLGGHTLGVGLDITSGDFTVTLGWARTWALTTRAPSDFRLDNPFLGGYAADREVPSGSYDGHVDQVGLLLEAEFGD